MLEANHIVAGDKKCLEIGAGMGRATYYAHQLGFQCTTIDLPMAIVSQALFLSAGLGEEAIWMIGDPELPKKNQIILLPTSEMHTLSNSYFDVILNADSLTEMGYGDAYKYMKFIEKNGRFFISINHEVNKFKVSELKDLVPNLKLLSRAPYWLRDGYVEEIFLCNN